MSQFLASSAKGSSGSTVVDLHPVVLLHIADHHHRNVAQHGGKAQIFGALLGRIDGRKTEIWYAFELLVTRVADQHVLDKQYWVEKEGQFKQVLPHLEYVGWYTAYDTDEVLSMDDLHLQNQFGEVGTNLFLLKARVNKNEAFPIQIFESVYEFSGGMPVAKFNPVAHNIVFEHAEQIGVSHMAIRADAEAAGAAGAETEYQLNLRSMSSAVRMLQERLSVISKYLAAVDAGTLPPDNDILIELKRIVELLGSLGSEEQQEKYNTVKLQAVMTASVGQYTQTVETLVEFIRKNALMVEKKTSQRGFPRGMGVGMGPATHAVSRGFPSKPVAGKGRTGGFAKGFGKSLFGGSRNRGDDGGDVPRSSGSSIGETFH